jgi:hypothetical protein
MSRKSMGMIVHQLFAVVLALSAGICGNVASAQDENQSSKPDRGVFVGSGANIVAVKNAPFSGEMVCTNILTRDDGSISESRLTTMYYRDGAGRIRREILHKNDGEIIRQQFEVIDHSGGQNFTLYPQNRTVIKSNSPIRSLAEGAYESQTLIFECGYGNNLLISSKGYPYPEVKIESLGTRVIEGLEAEGTRFTLTIPAGKINNEKPIESGYERWYSRELQLDVLIKSSDSRGMESTGRLINLKRGEPGAALFEIPPDYSLQKPGNLDPKTQSGIGARDRLKGPHTAGASSDEDAEYVYPMTAALRPTIVYKEKA